MHILTGIVREDEEYNMQVVNIDEGRLCFNLFDKKSGKLLDSSVYTNYATANMEKVDMLLDYILKNKDGVAKVLDEERINNVGNLFNSQT